MSEIIQLGYGISKEESTVTRQPLKMDDTSGQNGYTEVNGEKIYDHFGSFFNEFAITVDKVFATVDTIDMGNVEEDYSNESGSESKRMANGIQVSKEANGTFELIVSDESKFTPYLGAFDGTGNIFNLAAVFNVNSDGIGRTEVCYGYSATVTPKSSKDARELKITFSKKVTGRGVKIQDFMQQYKLLDMAATITA